MQNYSYYDYSSHENSSYVSDYSLSESQEIIDNPETATTITLRDRAPDERPSVKNTVRDAGSKLKRGFGNVKRYMGAKKEKLGELAAAKKIEAVDAIKEHTPPSVKKAFKPVGRYVGVIEPKDIDDAQIKEYEEASAFVTRAEKDIEKLEAELKEVSANPLLTPAERKQEGSIVEFDISKKKVALANAKVTCAKLRSGYERKEARSSLPYMTEKKKTLKAQKHELKKLVYTGKAMGVDGRRSITLTNIQRAAKVQELHKTEGELEGTRSTLKELKLKNQYGLARHKTQVKRHFSSLVSEFKKYGGTGRSATTQQSNTQGASPIALITAAKDFYNLCKAGKSVYSNKQRVKILRNLVTAIDDDIKALQHKSQTFESESERETFNELIAKAKAGRQELVEEIEKIPVGRDFQRLGIEVVKSAFSAIKTVQFTSFTLTLLGTGGSVISSIGSVAGVISVPFGLALGGIGLATSYENIQSAKKTLGQLDQLQQQQLENGLGSVQAFDDVLGMQEMNELSDLKQPIAHLNQYIKLAQAGIAEVDQRLLKGDWNPAQVQQLKGKRQEYQQGISRAHQELQTKLAVDMRQLTENAPARKAMMAVQQRLMSKELVIKNLQVTDEVLSPYSQQKIKTKELQSYIHVAADILAVAGTGIAGLGFVTSLAGGAGTPLIAAGVVLGLASPAVRYGGGFLVRKLRSQQLGKNRVSTKQFEKAIKERLTEEVQNWSNLEAAGYTENTTAHLLFPVMSQYYSSMPKSWGPKEWAQSIVMGNQADGKAWRHALKRMHYYDGAQFFNSHISKWMDKVGRKIVGATPGDLPLPPESRQAA